MNYLTVETRELEDLRRRNAVMARTLAEQSAIINEQSKTLTAQAKEIAWLRRTIDKALAKFSTGVTASCP